jgi:cytochrome c5
MIRTLFLALTLAAASSVASAQKQQPQPPAATPPASPPAAGKPHPEPSGEFVFNANCSRCHTAPEQLSPHISGTVLMHMRVRASLSAADEKILLQYLNQ